MGDSGRPSSDLPLAENSSSSVSRLPRRGLKGARGAGIAEKAGVRRVYLLRVAA